MTDRELLELAAKAIGKDGHYDEQWEALVCPVEPGEVPDEGEDFGFLYTFWDPLRDDGDALRLAVKLNLHRAIAEAHRLVSRDLDFYAATRLAIVRAAAQLEANGGKLVASVEAEKEKE